MRWGRINATGKESICTTAVNALDSDTNGRGLMYEGAPHATLLAREYSTYGTYEESSAYLYATFNGSYISNASFSFTETCTKGTEKGQSTVIMKLSGNAFKANTSVSFNACQQYNILVTAMSTQGNQTMNMTCSITVDLVPPPIIHAMIPQSAIPSSTNLVSFTGENFGNHSGVSVNLAMGPELPSWTNITRVSSTNITATPPIGITGHLYPLPSTDSGQSTPSISLSRRRT